MARLFQVIWLYAIRTRVLWPLGAALALIFLQASAAAATGATNELRPASLKISGYNLIGNRQLKRILRTVELSGKKPHLFDATFVEDAALILMSRIRHDGYLKPELRISLTLLDGTRTNVTAESLLEDPLPRPLQITAVHFQITKGPLYYYESLDFSGLESMPLSKAQGFFMEVGMLLRTRKSRIYTPEALKRSIANLSEDFQRRGYQNCQVNVSNLQTNDSTGATHVSIEVHQGPRYFVNSIREEFFYDGAMNPDETRAISLHKPYSKIWLQDFTQNLKTNHYWRGFPDVRVNTETFTQSSSPTEVKLVLRAEVHSGPKVHIAAVEFEGQKRTRRWLMARRVRVRRGDLLNPIRTEEGRYRLAQLGAFDRVELDYKTVDDQTRDVIYRVQEGKTLDVNLLFGWGSYELLRGGIVLDAYNIWGLGHHARVTAIQSFKSSKGEFTYTVPDIRGNDFDFFLHGSGLRREEPSFTREEYGGGAGVHKFYRPLSTDVTVSYNYQILDALSLVPAVASIGPTNPAVGSILLDLKHDRRDNPLYPRRGYKIFATIETASEYLGGEVNYERLEVWSSWHLPLGGGRWFNLGLSHGSAVSFGDPAKNLPFNRRFFPGGANSIRGYNDTDASPRDADGHIIGAETYTLGTVELEQALTPRWSVVAFSDNLGIAARIEDFPFDTGLFSIGGGLRWRTIIGPVRLEYGYNLNPRPKDPTGTIQFSLGYPF